MAAKLFVGSLAWATTDDSLRAFFSQAGNVVSAQVIIDRMSGRSKGFGFVEMSTDEEAKAALDLNGKELDGRAIVVNEARPREPRDFSGGGGGGYRGGRGGSGGGHRGGGHSDDRGGRNW